MNGTLIEVGNGSFCDLLQRNGVTVYSLPGTSPRTLFLFFFRVFKVLRESNPEIVARSNGSRRHRCVSLSGLLSLQAGYERAQLAPSRRAADVAGAYLQSADIFVLASHREGFGLALAEARSLSCAIVASDVGGIPEVLDWAKPASWCLPVRPSA